MIACPQEPEEEGYVFAGWYKDASCTKVWNFETDTVQEDITLYAKWNVVKQDISFCVSEISDVTYTGKALKPTVKVYDGETLLKQKKDYTITYHNSTNVNVVKAGSEFNPELPYVTIVGKGNYTDTIQINFNVLPAVIGDENGTQALGVNLKYNDQLVVNYNKDVIPFKSMSLGRTLNKGVDFDIALEPMDAVDANGEPLTDTISNGAVPAGSRGTFMLVINAKGNYTGCITKVISVTYKPNLLKNASITLGKNLKNIDFDTYQNLMKGKLTPAYYDKATKKYYAVTNGTVDYNSVLNAKDVFVVKYGNTSLVSGLLNSCTYIGSAISTYGIAALAETIGWKHTVFLWFLIAVDGSVICFACKNDWRKRFMNDSDSGRM